NSPQTPNTPRDKFSLINAIPVLISFKLGFYYSAAVLSITLDTAIENKNKSCRKLFSNAHSSSSALVSNIFLRHISIGDIFHWCCNKMEHHHTLLWLYAVLKERIRQASETIIEDMLVHVFRAMCLPHETEDFKCPPKNWVLLSTHININFRGGQSARDINYVDNPASRQPLFPEHKSEYYLNNYATACPQEFSALFYISLIMCF
ncbi:hypothetical protein L9F63_000096, partial [Diploptera punctata]